MNKKVEELARSIILDVSEYGQRMYDKGIADNQGNNEMRKKQIAIESQVTELSELIDEAQREAEKI
jgi:esterase/lipase